MTNAGSVRRRARSVGAVIFSLAAIIALGQFVPAHAQRSALGTRDSSLPAAAGGTLPPVLVIGFVGGFIRHDNLVHSEVQKEEVQKRDKGNKNIASNLKKTLITG